jgi:hypothetical protein
MSRMSVLKHEHRKGRSYVCGNAFAGARCCVSARICARLSRSAGQRGAGHAKVKTAITRNASIALTSHRPWRAPVGHFQPRRDEVPQPEEVSEWERQQKQFNEELDRRLIICRGC